MSNSITDDALKHLRHELRTPINHVLGYTDLLLEESEDEEGGAQVDPLRELNSGGRRLLEAIQHYLNDSAGTVTALQLQELEQCLRPEAEALIITSSGLAGTFLQAGRAEAAGDVAKITEALRRLVGIARQAAGDPTPMEPHPVPAAEPPDDQDLAADPPAFAPGGPSRILIAEDVAANRDILRRRLVKEGYHVSEAENGLEALRMLETDPYDLLILDLMMPEMDGFEVLKRLKVDALHPGLPVIMISALDEIHSVVRCIEMGAEDYLPKPFNPVLLRARVGASLEKKRLRDLERQKTLDLQKTLERLKETQAQLVVQEKMASLGVLTAGIAHEIKNPLNFVTNFAQLSVDLLEELKVELGKMEQLVNRKDAEYLDGLAADLSTNLCKIQEHGKRADSIVRGMLAHSRGGSGQAENVDLNTLAAEAVNLAYHGLRAKDAGFNITLEKHFDPSLPPVLAFPQDLSRVVLNLANNGCYAARQKHLKLGPGFRPTLGVSTSHSSTEVFIKIRDNGTGIPKHLLDQIFNPFFTTKPTGSGTGLGLSLSYQIVTEQHRGSIQVNTEEGEFTEFVITLPRRLRESE